MQTARWRWPIPIEQSVRVKLNLYTCPSVAPMLLYSSFWERGERQTRNNDDGNYFRQFSIIKQSSQFNFLNSFQ